MNCSRLINVVQTTHFLRRFLVFLAIITATCSQDLKEDSKVFNYKVQFDPTVFLQSLDDAPVDTGDFDIQEFINNFASADNPIQTVEQSSESDSVKKPTTQETTTLTPTTSSSTTQTTTTTSSTTTTSAASSTKSTSPVKSVSLSVDSLFGEETELPTTSSLAETLLRPEANSDLTTEQFFSDEEEGVNSVEQSAASVLDYNHYNYNYVNIVPVYPLLYHMRPSYYQWHYFPIPVPLSYHHQYSNMKP